MRCAKPGYRNDRASAALLRSMVADVVGYSKLIGSDEAGTLAQLEALRTEIIEPVCLPKTRSDSIDDEVRRGSAEQRAGRAVGSADGPANPCPGTDAFGSSL